MNPNEQSSPDDLAKAIDEVKRLWVDHDLSVCNCSQCRLVKFAEAAAKQVQELQEQLEAMTNARDLYKENLRKTVEYYEQQRNAK